MNIIDEYQEEINDNCPEIKEIIDGLSKINIDNVTPRPVTEEPVSLDVEMKRLLSEMMTPPYEVVNYENTTLTKRKDGVGDQPNPSLHIPEREIQVEQLNEDPPKKPIEKKSRITDLVMNSKKLLSNLINEEQKRKQEDWEENNEMVIKVIELNLPSSDDQSNLLIKPEDVPFPQSDEEIDDQLIMNPKDENLDNIELTTEDALKGGKGDDVETTDVEPNLETVATTDGELLENLELDKDGSNKSGTTKSKNKKKKGIFFKFNFFGFRKKNKNKAEVKEIQETVAGQG